MQVALAQAWEAIARARATLEAESGGGVEDGRGSEAGRPEGAASLLAGLVVVELARLLGHVARLQRREFASANQLGFEAA